MCLIVIGNATVTPSVGCIGVSCLGHPINCAISPIKSPSETLAKVGERNEFQGARNAGSNTYQIDRRSLRVARNAEIRPRKQFCKGHSEIKALSK